VEVAQVVIHPVAIRPVAGNQEAVVPVEEDLETYSAIYWVAASRTMVAQSILNPPHESLRIC
jgi:hypothetical protein